MQLHELKRKTPNKAKTLVGRGGKRGKTSGRGHKGQKAHGSHGIRPEMRDLIKKIPKRRGYGKNRARTVNSSRVKAFGVNVATLEQVFDKGTEVTPGALVGAGVARTRGGKMPVIKILGNGEITKDMKIKNCLVSETAKQKIEKAGGTIA